MNSNLRNTIKNAALLYCVMFTSITLVSSILQLWNGQLTDTNSHIINRAVVVLIGVVTLIVFDKVRLRSKILSHLTAYAISMATVFLYVWITGFFEELHPNAYRDIFLNYTPLVIIVSIITAIRDYRKEKSKIIKNEHNL